MFSVYRFLARTTVFSCRGESPEYWSLLDISIHLGNFFLSWSLGSRTYAGHPHGLSFFMSLWEGLYLVQTSCGDIPLDIWVLWLCKWTAWAIDKGQRLFSFPLVHLIASWIIMVVSILTTFFIAFYANPLWWLPPTPMCLIPCPLPLKYLVKSLEL